MGAPKARALALGFHDRTNGTAAAAEPTAATVEVANNKYRRDTGSLVDSVKSIVLLLQDSVDYYHWLTQTRGLTILFNSP